MKKVILILVGIVMLSCSDDVIDTSNPDKASNTVGTWMLVATGEACENGAVTKAPTDSCGRKTQITFHSNGDMTVESYLGYGDNCEFDHEENGSWVRIDDVMTVSWYGETDVWTIIQESENKFMFRYPFGGRDDCTDLRELQRVN